MSEYHNAAEVIDSEGLELLLELRSARTRRAKQLWEARASTLANSGGDVHWRNHCTRLLAYGNGEPLLKPTPENLMREARILLGFSGSPLPGIHGSGSYDMDDGYSCCGLADAHQESRDGAFAEALLYFAAAKWAF